MKSNKQAWAQDMFENEIKKKKKSGVKLVYQISVVFQGNITWDKPSKLISVV